METVTGRYRLSPQQRRAWALQSTQPRPVHHAACVLALRGAVDEDVLRRAVESAAERHEVLRTVYRPLPGTTVPVQEIRQTLPPAWTRMDVGSVDESAAAAALLERLDGEAVDYAAGPVLRAAFASVDEGRHLLALDLPALAADAVTMGNLAAEVADAYAALASGAEPAAPELQYADVAGVFNDLLESEETREGRRYWAEAAPAASERGGGFAPRTTVLALDADDAQRVRALAEGMEAAPAAVLLAAWGVLLARTHGARQVGVAFDGRVYEGLDVALGAFVRYLPVAVDGAGSFRDAVAAAAASLAERAEWQDYFDPAHDLSAGAYPFGFDWTELTAARDAGSVTVRVAAIRARAERFDLRLAAVAEAEGGVRIEIEHDPAHVSDAEAERTAARLRLLLDDALRRPDAPAASLAIVGAAEREALLALGRGAGQGVGAGCIHHAFAEQASRTPDRVAVTSGGRSLTYAQLEAAANRLAHRLRAEGVGPETAVGLYLERSTEAVTGIVAILKAGGTLVPLDPAYPPERIARMVRQAKVAVTVTVAPLRIGLPDDARVVALDAEADRLAALPATPPEVDVDARNTAYVIFTSGSTGEPKGVAVPHGAALSLFAALDGSIYRDRGALRVSVNAPFTFDGSVKQWLQLLGGHTLHVIAEEDRLSAERLLAHVRHDGIQVLDCTPTQLHGLLAAGFGAAEEPVRVLLCGGEAVDAALWARLGAIPGVEAFNVYGPTEFTVDATAARVINHDAPTLGGPLAGARVTLVDDGGAPAPWGAAGEICLAGERVARGYLADPALTAERFVPDAFGAEPGARAYRTGDLARWTDAGTLEFLGRADGQVKVRGVRMELGEVEAVLREEPGVAAAAARVHGEGPEAQVAAYFVPVADVDAEALRGALTARLRSRLPAFMVPGWVVPLAALPLTASGKTDRRALPDPHAAQPAPRAPYAAPATELEATIARVWQELLGVERVGVNDNFFDLGGNSLLIVQAYDRLREATGTSLSLVELFRFPTVTLLAGHLAGGSAPQESRLSEAEERARRQREALARQGRPAAPGSTPAE